MDALNGANKPKGKRTHTVELSDEEYKHLMARRAALQQFIDFCKQPIPEGEYRAEESMKAQTHMEDQLRIRWGILV